MLSDTEFSEEAMEKIGLMGKRVVVTRAEHQAQELAQLLRAKDAEPVLYPCISIAPPDNPEALDKALQDAFHGEFDWLVLTSANTVRVLSQRVEQLEINLDNIKAAAIGPRTAIAAEKQLQVNVEVIADSYVAEGLVEALPKVAGNSVFLPQASAARPVLAEGLTLAGAMVTALEAYKIEIGQGGAAVPKMLADGHIDAVIFSSPVTVRYFLERLKQEGGHRDGLKGVCLAALGPVTAKAMRQAGLTVEVQPARYTLFELVAALDAHFKSITRQPVKE